MDIIKPEAAAKIVVGEIEKIINDNPQLKREYTNGCTAVVGMEALCRESRQELDMRRNAINFGEASIEALSKKDVIGGSSQVLVDVFACALNSRLYGVMSSYNPNCEDEVNRHGCVSFDVMNESGFLKRRKKWARYFVSVQLVGASEETNEMLAVQGAFAVSSVLKGCIISGPLTEAGKCSLATVGLAGFTKKAFTSSTIK